MRTKHLFYTAAMAALFAACVNDDFETISKGQNAANDGRPVVTDVKLKFTTGADTRLAFGGEGYAWETNDTIGALLMDNVLTLEENTSWLQKYQLVDNIHTSYPFTYSTTDQTWGCNTKMLEGNYFFAYPWESYEGRREVAHSLLKQSQNGISGDVVAESYADNQFFIGYSQIKAGTDAKDALTDVEMVPLLGAIQLRIVNTGTQSYHLNKIVLSGNSGIASVMTFNPTKAEYETWNLVDGKGVNWVGIGTDEKYFNYANYTGNEADTYTYGGSDAVYNIKEGDEYKRIEALRAVAKEHPTLSTENSAQLTINGTAEERVLLPGQGNTAYVLIMCNPIEVVENTGVAEDGYVEGKNGLRLSIYADEGFVQNIDLSKVNGESTTNTVVTDAKVSEVGPSVKNTIRIQLEDNSFITPETMTVYNSSDLLQFIQWNAQIAGRRDMVATLGQDVTFSKEMLEALVGTDPKVDLNKYLKINDGTNNNTLTLAEDLPADVLDSKYLDIDAKLIVKGELELTEDSKIGSGKSIEVAEEASLTIDDAKAEVPTTITNYGTVTLGANSAVKSGTIHNYGTMNVVKGGDSKATVINYEDAVINNNGYMQKVTNNEDATIILGEGATLSANRNNGKIVTAKGATATVENNNDGEIQYVDGAIINATTGIISTEFSGNIEKDTFKDTKVNKIIITGSAVVKETASMKYVEITEGGELLVDEKVEFTVSDKLTISGEATIGGKGKVISSTDMEIEEEGSLTVANTATVVAEKNFLNNGIVYNNGKFNTPDETMTGTDSTTGQAGKGDWKYNTPGNSTKDTSKQDAMDAAVTTWAGCWGLWSGKELEDFYDYNPYNYIGFVKAMNQKNVTDWVTLKAALVKAGFEMDPAKIDEKDEAPAEFTTAVNTKVLKATDWTALSKEIIDENGAFRGFTMPTADATLYKKEADAYDAFCKHVAAQTITSVDRKKTFTAIEKASIWLASDDVIKAALAETNVAENLYYLNGAYAYIWEGCKLDVVMNAYNTRTIAQWNDALGGSSSLNAVKSRNDLIAWMNAIYSNAGSTNGFVKAAYEAIDDYMSEFEDWGYISSQITSLNKKDE